MHVYSKTIDGNACVFIDNKLVETFSKYEDFAFTSANELLRAINCVLTGWYPDSNRKKISNDILEIIDKYLETKDSLIK